MFAGSWIDQPVPWTYLPGWFAAQLPLLIVIAGTSFALIWAWQALKVATRGQSWLSTDTIVSSTPVLLQALMLPTIAIILQATVYKGVR